MIQLTFNIPLKKTNNHKIGSSDQDGGVGRNALLPRTTKRRITTNLKAKNNQNF